MRNVYIINPKAGKHDHTVQFMERIRAVHATHGEEPEIYLTQRAGHGEELARAAAEKGDAVRSWSVGGDGTVLEVVRGAEFHKNVAVGVTLNIDKSHALSKKCSRALRTTNTMKNLRCN